MQPIKRSWLIFILLLFYGCFPSYGNAKDADLKLGTITIVSDDNYPPYIFRDANGMVQGILVDEWALWEKKTGIRVHLNAMDWGKAKAVMASGQADVIDTIFFTQERGQIYDFTEPYATIDVPVFFHKNIGGIVNIESLKGLTIGVKSGDACIDVLKQNGIKSLQEFNSYISIIQAAAEGQIKVFSIDKPPALYYLYKLNLEDEFRYSLNLYTGKFHRAVKKGRTDLLTAVEDGFALISKEEHDAIYKKWMGEPLVHPQYFRYLSYFFIFAGAIFLGLIFFNIALRKKVRKKTAELQKAVDQLTQSEEEIIKRETFLNVIIENIPNMLFVKDARELRFVRFNKAGEQLIGVSKEELIGKNDYDFFPENEADFFTGKDRETLRKGELLDIPEEIIQTRDKGTRTLHTKKIPLFDQNGMPEYLLGISEDITERKQFEEQLRQTQKMESIGQLAGGIAHDFNNILSGIFGFSQLARNHLNEPQRAAKDIDQLIKIAHKARVLVQQILAVSRKTVHQKQPFCISDVVEDALNLLRATIPTSIDIKESMDSEATIMGDPTQIHQVIMNLCTNAYHAMADSGGIMSICLGETEFRQEDIMNGMDIEPGRFLVLEISDTGHGIEPAIMGKIFEPYFTTKDSSKGTGLGLAVVFGIVQEHKGHIKAKSQLGRGTTFYVYLPIIEMAAEPVTEVSQSMGSKGNEKIMLVDDEIDILDTLKPILGSQGYQVSTFDNGESALEAFIKDPDRFDLIITDMTMPKLTGDRLSMEILKIRRELPIILCTGYHENFAEKDAIILGVKKYIQKPVMGAELSRAIRELLDKK